MKKLASILLSAMLLMTMALPAYAEEVASEPSSEAPVTEHVCSFTETVSRVEATCTSAGSVIIKCICGETKTEEIPQKEHTYGSAANVDAAHHKFVCSVCQQEALFAHTYGAWTKTSDAHSRSCTACGVVENGRHSLKEEVVKEATCKEDGSKKKSCTVCDYSETIVLQKKEDHTYDNACDGECNVCHTKRDVQHTYTTVWSSGPKGHWHECTKCGDQKDFAAHVPGPGATEEKAQVCTVCNYVVTPKKDHVHSYGEEWSSDEVGHWHGCATCHKEKDYGSHVFDDECDSDCNTCGYKRKNSHSYDKEGWKVSKFDHWNICAVCAEESEKEKHIPGPEATEKDPQLCTVCGYELAPVTEHSHDFGNEYQVSETDHWQECECGEKSVPMAHIWNEGKENRNDTVTFTCTVCGAEKLEAVKSSGFPWLILVLVILALICVGGIVAIVIILKRGDFEEDGGEDTEPEDVFEPEEEPEVDEEEKMIDDFFASIDEESFK